MLLHIRIGLSTSFGLSKKIASLTGLLRREAYSEMLGLLYRPNRNTNSFAFTKSVRSDYYIIDDESLALQIVGTLFIITELMKSSDDLIGQNLVESFIGDDTTSAERCDGCIVYRTIDLNRDGIEFRRFVRSLRNERVDSHLQLFRYNNPIALAKNQNVTRHSRFLQSFEIGDLRAVGTVDGFCGNFLHNW